jgi:hypothetical protein
MTYEIKKIDVWSCVKIAFVLFGIIGLLIGILGAIILTLVGGILSQMGEGFEPLKGIMGGFSIFMVPLEGLFYAVFGAVGTAILTWIYNLLASGLGGIKFNLVEEGSKSQISPPKSEPDSEGMLGKYKYE